MNHLSDLTDTWYNNTSDSRSLKELFDKFTAGQEDLKNTLLDAQNASETRSSSQLSKSEQRILTVERKVMKRQEELVELGRQLVAQQKSFLEQQTSSQRRMEAQIDLLVREAKRTTEEEGWQRRQHRSSTDGEKELPPWMPSWVKWLPSMLDHNVLPWLEGVRSILAKIWRQLLQINFKAVALLSLEIFLIEFVCVLYTRIPDVKTAWNQKMLFRWRFWQDFVGKLSVACSFSCIIAIAVALGLVSIFPGLDSLF